MGWGCYKHEWDKGSESWEKTLAELCERKLEESPRTFGRDGQICPECWNELEKENSRLQHENEELRDKLADTNYDMLCRFDREAAESTDLHTWIQCKLSELKKANETVQQAYKLLQWHPHTAVGALKYAELEKKLEKAMGTLWGISVGAPVFENPLASRLQDMARRTLDNIKGKDED